MKQSRLVSCQDNPFDHFEEAKTKRHPKAFEKAGRSLPADIVFAIDFCLKLGIPKLASFRRRQMQVLNSVVKQTSVLNEWILSNAPRPKHVRQAAPNVNIAILCLFCDAVNMDHDLGRDFLYGFRLCGIIPDSGSHRVVTRPPEDDFQSACRDLDNDAWANLLKIERQVAASGPRVPPEDARELLRVTNEQVGLNRLNGPFSRSELMTRLCGTPQPKRDSNGVLRAPVTCIRFGVRQEDKLRPCEDWKSNNQNRATSLGETVAPISFEEPAILAERIFLHSRSINVDPPELHVGLDDVMHGYNNFPSDREHALCAWHPDKKAPAFWTSKVMVFGATASVNHFCRLPILLERIGTRLAATMARSYVDDWIITDFLHAGDSAQQCISAIHKSIRIPLHACNHPSCPNCTSNPRGPAPDPRPKCKRRRPAAVQELLGTICDVTYAHLGRVSYWPKPSRCSKILSFLRNAKETNHMTPKAAQRLDGKMQFLTRSSLFGSVGRAQTSCIRRRAHSKCVVQGWQTDTSTTWHPTMSDSLSFLELILHPDRVPHRVVSFLDDQPVILYSDAEGSDFGIGLIAWDPLFPATTFSSSDTCPSWLLNHVTTRSGPSTDGRQNIINPVELIGSLTALWTYRDLVRGRRVLLFQDNSTAFTAAITGYSDSDIVREIAGLFHLSAAALNVSLWIEHVQTEAMLADIPSRNSGFGHQHEARFRLLATSQRPISFPPQELWHDSVGMFELLRRGA
jgi:hypothetical protein